MSAPLGDDVIHDGEDLGEGVGTKEGYTGLLEVIETFEYRRSGKMPAGMDDAFSFVIATPLYGGKHMFLKNIYFFRHRPRRSR